MRGVGYQFVRSPEEGALRHEESFHQDPALVSFDRDGHVTGDVLHFEYLCPFAPAGVQPYRFELRERAPAWETDGSAGLNDSWRGSRTRPVPMPRSLTGTDTMCSRGVTGRRKSRRRRAGYEAGYCRSYRSCGLRAGAEFITVTLSRDKKYYFVAIYPCANPPGGLDRAGAQPDLVDARDFRDPLLRTGEAADIAVRKMQKTIERFGRGDFSARVNSRRAR